MKFEILIDLEKKLGRTEYRGSREKLESLFDNEFREVMGNGDIWSREKVINSTVATSSLDDYSSYDFEVIELSQNVGLVLFKTVSDDGSVITQRSSTWRWKNDAWKNVFHHATRLS